MSTWVIGGTSGIGQQVVKRCEISSLIFGKVYATGDEVDVRDYDAMRDFLDHIVLDIGDPLKQVVFCAGINNLEWLGKMGAHGCSDQLSLFEVNVFGFIQLMDLLVYYHTHNIIPRNHRFQVVVVSSDASSRPLRTSIGYCASKAALDMAVRVAAREAGPNGWNIWGVNPGMMQQGQMTEYVDQRVPEVRGWDPEQMLSYERSQAVVKHPLRIASSTLAKFIVENMAPNYAHLNGSMIQFNGGR